MSFFKTEDENKQPQTNPEKKNAENESKNQPIILNKGAFANVPTEIIYLIMTYVDIADLNNLAKINTTFRGLVDDFPKQIDIEISNKKYTGNYLEIKKAINTDRDKAREQKKIREIAQQKLDAEETQIDEIETTIDARKKTIQNTWYIPPKNSFFTQEEKAAVGCCCVIGGIGGILTACFTSWSCFATTAIGMALGGTTPIVLSRGTRCLCNACVACKERSVETRKDKLNKDYPAPNLSMNP